ncbi:hypothetical protein CDAR_93271 [Caerostris darwini]|uniref:Uncharacterized protein n=1 Tax=Caerostris darwini TaxID=1538125 RepID=A0AAV4UWL6_9ARAC|nr:hypothetical protein CDAR_93271 [Caerostris darwini]
MACPDRAPLGGETCGPNNCSRTHDECFSSWWAPDRGSLKIDVSLFGLAGLCMGKVLISVVSVETTTPIWSSTNVGLLLSRDYQIHPNFMFRTP